MDIMQFICHLVLVDIFFFNLDLMDLLREIPGREALKLRADVSPIHPNIHATFFSSYFVVSAVL